MRKIPQDWAKVIEYIERPGNLDKMKAIIGSLGRYADQVWLGGLTVKEIGDVIGGGPPIVRIAPKAEPRDYCGHPISESKRPLILISDGVRITANFGFEHDETGKRQRGT